MENNDINSLIKEFCNYLREYIPEFQELWEAQKALDNDPISKKLWENKEERRQTIELLKTKGLPITPKQEDELTQKLKEMRENPITMRYLKAKNYARKIAAQIGNQLETETGWILVQERHVNKLRSIL